MKQSLGLLPGSSAPWSTVSSRLRGLVRAQDKQAAHTGEARNCPSPGSGLDGALKCGLTQERRRERGSHRTGRQDSWPGGGEAPVPQAPSGELHGGRNQDTNRRCSSLPPVVAASVPRPQAPGHLGTWAMYSPHPPSAIGVLCSLCTEQYIYHQQEEREEVVPLQWLVCESKGRGGAQLHARPQARAPPGPGQRSAVWLPLLKG